VRAFLALVMPPAVCERLAGCARVLRPRIPGARWTDPASLHLTLRFLGERAAADHEACGRQAALGLALLPRPPLALGTLGVFPEGGPARVIWAGLQDAEGRLRAAGEICEAAARATGYPLEERPFHPHVTLARIAERRGPRGVGPILEEASAQLASPAVPPLEAHEAVLFESRLAPGGPTYRPLARFPFADPGPVS